MLKRKFNRNIVLAVIILLLVGLILIIILRLSLEIKANQSKNTPTCGAIPTQFVVDEPECANRLLVYMNITNVHIESHDSLIQRKKNLSNYTTSSYLDHCLRWNSSGSCAEE